jgi:hypothetical protein
MFRTAFKMSSKVQTILNICHEDANNSNGSVIGRYSEVERGPEGYSDIECKYYGLIQQSYLQLRLLTPVHTTPVAERSRRHKLSLFFNNFIGYVAVFRAALL